jgi:NAD(P)-dependent dehydrogenase (short-subunit alcohol dehydrogenase family)
MLLSDKVAVVYGAGGKVGSAVARTFAAEGARLFLAGRSRASVQATADQIVAAGGRADVAEFDALEAGAVERHMSELIGQAGRLDVSFNAMSFRGDLQGTPLLEMVAGDFVLPVSIAMSGHFLTAQAAGRRMATAGSGVIIMLSASATALSARDRKWHKTGGFGVACAAIEELSRSFAGELGPRGVRVVCLRSDAISETWAPEHRGEGSKTKVWMDSGSLLGSLPTLQQLADAAAFAASDRASAMTGAILNVTRGSVMGIG